MKWWLRHHHHTMKTFFVKQFKLSAFQAMTILWRFQRALCARRIQEQTIWFANSCLVEKLIRLNRWSPYMDCSPLVHTLNDMSFVYIYISVRDLIWQRANTFVIRNSLFIWVEKNRINRVIFKLSGSIYTIEYILIFKSDQKQTV